LKGEFAGLITGAATVLGGLGGTALGGLLGDRLRRKIKNSYFAVPAFAMIPGAALTLGIFSDQVYVAVVCVCLCEIALFCYNGPITATIANCVSPNIRARAFGVNILMIHLFGDAWSPIVIGIISDSTANLVNGIFPVTLTIIIAGVIWLIAWRICPDLDGLEQRVPLSPHDVRIEKGYEKLVDEPETRVERTSLL